MNLELVEKMVLQYDSEAQKAHNNSHYFKGAADGLRQLVTEQQKLEQDKSHESDSPSPVEVVGEDKAAEAK